MIFAEILGPGIESKIALEPCADIAQVTDRRAEPAQFDLRIGTLPTFYAIQKIPQMRSA